MAKNMDIPLLYDYYGELLTEKQRNVIELYYHQDLSLSEIAENVGISRQGVRDSVKRAEIQLTDMETQLGIAARMKLAQQKVAAIRATAEALLEENDRSGGSAAITDYAERIIEITHTLGKH